MVVNFFAIVWLCIGLAAGLFLGTFLRLGMPPVAGELIIDTHEWNVDKFNFHMNRMPFTEIAEHKYVALKITQATIVDPREINNDFNDTD